MNAVLVTLGLAGLSGMSACQSNPQPPPAQSASETPTPSPSSSPSPTAPSLPAEARGKSQAAAKAFVRHYIGLINHAMATGETAPLLAASAPNCTSCGGVAERVDAVYSAGGSIESDGWRVNSIKTVPAQPSTRPRFDIGLTMSPQEVVEQAGRSAKTFEGGKLPATFTLLRRGDAWTVLHWERAA